jgi:hypothetical protein
MERIKQCSSPIHFFTSVAKEICSSSLEYRHDGGSEQQVTTAFLHSKTKLKDALIAFRAAYSFT